jgi:hypothetical protein
MRILTTALLLVPAVALAGSALDGTWKSRPESMKFSGKPDTFLIADGTYTCSTCTPEIKVTADGTDQKVSGHPYYDTVAVKVVSPTVVEITEKRAGKVMYAFTLTASADGKTLSGKIADHTGSKTATGAYTASRVAAAPAGAHAISGSWQVNAFTGGNDVLRTVSYAMTADGLSMHWNGQSYEAKFDGKEYPIVGDPGHTKVTLKKVDDNTVEETDHRMGKVTDEVRLAAAADGKTLTVTDQDVQHNQTTTLTFDKQ